MPKAIHFDRGSTKAKLRLALMLTLGAIAASALMIPASWSLIAIPSFGVPPESRVPVLIGTAIGRLLPCVAAAFIGAFLATQCSEATHRLRWTRRGFISAIIFAFILVSTMLGTVWLLRAHLPSLPSDYVFPPVWQGLALLLGAAYFEELIFRFGLVSLCIFLVARVRRQESSDASCSWIAIGAASLVFALLHLIPLGLLVDVTSLFLLGAFAVVLVAGVGLGIIFVQHGLHFAVLAHAIANTSLYLIVRFGFLEL